MNDPSQGVAPELIQHVHLLSVFRFPKVNRPSLAWFVEQLHKAPRIFYEVNTVTWQILENPPEGFMALVWQPPQLQGHFASDGYIWADPESFYRQDVQGSPVEVALHKAGFSPRQQQQQGTQFCTISRRRYRLRPSGSGAETHPVDPNLWLVHYDQASPRDQIPIARVPRDETAQILWQQRMQILQHGQLAKREFMFNDRANYPMIPYPAAAAAAARPNPRYPPGTAQYQQAMMKQNYQPASKRQRTGAPGAPIGRGQARGYLKEDEREYGDVIDHLSQRDIAVQRFTQHHEWLEEVFASPYATAKIQPVALGFGLTGELEPLTRGIFNAPDPRPETPAENAKPKTYGVEVATPLSPEKEREFARRVADKIAQDNAEIEEMERKHQERLASLKNGAQLLTAERQLRTANWESEKQASGATPTGEGAPTLESLVEAVESKYGRCTAVNHDIRLVERGGLQYDSSPDAQPGDKDVEMDGVTTQAMTTEELRAPAIESAADTPSFSGDFAAPSTSTSTPNNLIAAPQTTVVPMMESGAGDASDYVAVDQDTPSAPNAGPEALAAVESMGIAQNDGADDIGDDLLDFDGEAVDAAVEGDLYTGGAFEEAMELTDPVDDAETLVPAPDTMPVPSAPPLDAAAAVSGPAAGVVAAQAESLMTDDGASGYGSAPVRPSQRGPGMQGIEQPQPTPSEAPVSQSDAAAAIPQQTMALGQQSLDDNASGM